MKFFFIFLILINFCTFVYSDSISLYEENDVLHKDSSGSTTDGYYTQGFQILYQNNKKDWGIKLAQQIYTPENKDSDQPQYNDRPYAGWLNATFFKDYFKQDNSIDSFSVGLGIVGPASGAEWVQTEFHKLFDMALPMGWKYQLYNELTIQFSYMKTYSLFLNDYIEYRPFTSINFGNALIDAEIGNVIRTGWNIPKKFDPIIKTPIESNFKNKSFKDEFFSYIFAGCKGKIIVRDIFLDGNTFKKNIVTVDKEICVADFYFGASIGLKYIDITVTHVEKTKEFKTQIRNNRFDSIQLTYNF